ncbi:rolling circle replication-associated protein [Anaeromassilibacillus senegalensis]|uniref:rolling circle replication-associated protein n=1 Tax=Anaeromassilibacillus senegalensis TaxID=1673717 RepID=UPI0006831556|nr:hypothetical protein [Anaeromassilibacillus senegalensis]
MYLKKTCKAGITIEVHKSYSARYGRNIPRGNRENRTPEAMKKYNEKMAWRKLTRQINANFVPRDLFLTCTYRKEVRPDPQRAKQNIENFLDRVRRRFKKAGVEFKYILVTAYGKQGGIHHHVIIPAFDYQVVTACWPHGAMRFEALYPDGEYSALAWYLIKQSRLSPDGRESIPGNRWSGSRNLIKPVEKVQEVDAREWREEPKPVKGYYIDPNSVENGISPVTGIPYQFYRMIQLRPFEKGRSKNAKRSAKDATAMARYG